MTIFLFEKDHSRDHSNIVGQNNEQELNSEINISILYLMKKYLAKSAVSEEKLENHWFNKASHLADDIDDDPYPHER